jgi:hypothetical protein
MADEPEGILAKRGRLDAEQRLALPADEHVLARAIGIAVKEDHDPRDLLDQTLFLHHQILQALGHCLK